MSITSLLRDRPPRAAFIAVLSFALIALAACGAPRGPHVRFAHATRTEIEAARGRGQVVWYDFEAGDEVPLAFGLFGVSEAVTDHPTRMVARRPFSIVVFPSGETMFSFDGRSLTSPAYAARWSVALDADEAGGRMGMLVFIGLPGDLPPELR